MFIASWCALVYEKQYEQRSTGTVRSNHYARIIRWLSCILMCFSVDKTAKYANYYGFCASQSWFDVMMSQCQLNKMTVPLFSFKNSNSNK